MHMTVLIGTHSGLPCLQPASPTPCCCSKQPSALQPARCSSSYGPPEDTVRFRVASTVSCTAADQVYAVLSVT